MIIRIMGEGQWRVEDALVADQLPRHAALPDHRADALQLNGPHAEPISAVALLHALQPASHFGVAERPLIGHHGLGVLQDGGEIGQIGIVHPTQRQALRLQHGALVCVPVVEWDDHVKRSRR